MPPQTSEEPIQELSNSATLPKGGEQKQEILIDGRWIDVTTFVKRHPGGKVISYMVGTDGTQAFNEFHERSESAKRMLKNMKSRPNDQPEPSALLQDYEKLRLQFVKEGMFEPSLPHVLYRLGEIVLLHVAGVYLLNNEALPLPLRAFGLLLLGIAQGRCGWYMHEGGHYSLTGNIVIDRTLQEYVYGVGCGMSGAWWRSQHNRHHATPQKLQHDVDLETLPLVAFHEAIIARVRKNRILLRTWLSLQAYLFAPVTTFLVAIGWQLYLHPRLIIHKKLVNEAVAISARYLIIFGFVLKHYPLSTAIGLYCLYVWIGAMYIFVNFAVSHTHRPVLDADKHVDWVRYASDHTTNVSPSWWCDWWMGYLNYQIEHHLFPCMPQFRHPKIAPRVKQLFEKHGIAYDVRSYPECLLATFNNLNEVAHAEPKK